jgi:hypothetical protein
MYTYMKHVHGHVHDDVIQKYVGLANVVHALLRAGRGWIFAHVIHLPVRRARCGGGTPWANSESRVGVDVGGYTMGKQ